MRTAVVLPAPFGPNRPRIVPGATSRLTPASARTRPKDLCRLSATMAGLPSSGGDPPGRLATVTESIAMSPHGS